MHRLSPSWFRRGDVARTGDSAPASLRGFVVEQCQSCGSERARRFCAACGEKRIEPADLSLRGFLRDLAEELTELDGRVPRTLISLFKSPGLLTADWIKGRRNLYLRPVQLFLVLTLFFFFAAPHVGLLRWDLSQYEGGSPPGPVAGAMVRRHLDESGQNPRQYQAAFDRTLEDHKRLLIPVVVPLFALLGMLLYPRSGRFYVEHLVFAIHFFAAFFLYMGALLPLLVRALYWLLSWVLPPSAIEYAFGGSEFAMTLLIVLPTAAYLYLALRRTFGGGARALLGRTVVLTAGSVGLLLIVYRSVLFFSTFYTLKYLG